MNPQAARGSFVIRVFLAAILGTVPCGADPLMAQSPASVAPVSPPDDAIVGPRPLFEVEYAGIEDNKLRDARFRIVLSRDGFRTEAYRFDQRKRRTGWLPGDTGRMLYRPRMPLEDGSYVWRTAFWNGARWVEGQQTARLRVDTVPPAEVGGVRAMLDRSRGEVALTWDPVVFDRDGQPEYVARYRVLRYASGPPWPVARAFEVGDTPDLSWVEESSLANESGLTVYRVIAEDEAGNAGSGRR